MNKSVKDWINGKPEKAVFQIQSVSTGHKNHRSGAGQHDSRPKRMRTRANSNHAAIREF